MKLNPFRQEGLVESLCRLSGNRWQVTSIEGDMHYVRDSGPAAVRYILVRYQKGLDWMKFSSEFPVKFPLTGTPEGIFAQMLIRNTGLRYAHWNMDLAGSCEGQPYMVGQRPASIMTPSMFDATCDQIDREIREFHQELRSKFRGDMGRPIPTAGYPPIDSEIRFLGPVVNRPPERMGPKSLPGY